jgi:hypothetical protein
MPTPDYHFLYIDPIFGPDWLFVAAQRYFDRYRPMVVADLDLIGYIYYPDKRSIAITALARRDFAPQITQDITKRFPKAMYDPLVYDFVDELRLTLDGRVDFQQRFGVPDSPTPTPTRGSVR